MRFSGFDDEWIEEKLGNLVQIKSGECTKNLITGIDNSIPYFKVEQLNNSLKYQIKTPYFINDKSKIVNKGSIIFPKRGAAILLNKIRILNQDSFMDTNLMTLTPNNKLYNEFLYYFIYKENLSKIADTTSIPQLNNKHIKPYPIKLPSFEEQLKISKFISSVDKKVSLLSQNLEIFNDFKKGLLQQIFTQKLRFNFDDEWKQYKLKDVLTVKSSSISINQLEENTGDYPLYGASGFLKNIDFCEMDVDYISIVKDGSGVGNLSFHEKNSSIVNTSQYLLPKKNFNINFLYYLLQTINLMKYVNGSSIPHIYFKDYCIEKINIPSLDEQEKIGKLFVDVDITMENLNKNINATQEFKKGLLQQMFVVRINWRCNFKLAKSPSFNKHLLILKNKIIFIIIK